MFIIWCRYVLQHTITFYLPIKQQLLAVNQICYIMFTFMAYNRASVQLFYVDKYITLRSVFLYNFILRIIYIAISSITSVVCL